MTSASFELPLGDVLDELLELVGALVEGDEHVLDLAEVVALLEDAGRHERHDPLLRTVDLLDSSLIDLPLGLGKLQGRLLDVLLPLLDVLADDLVGRVHGKAPGWPSAHEMVTPQLLILLSSPGLGLLRARFAAVKTIPKASYCLTKRSGFPPFIVSMRFSRGVSFQSLIDAPSFLSFLANRPLRTLCAGGGVLSISCNFAVQLLFDGYAM